MLLIDEYTLISDILAQHPQTGSVFFEYNTLCVGCLVASFHTIQDACQEHNLDKTAFLRDLTAAIAKASGSA